MFCMVQADTLSDTCLIRISLSLGLVRVNRVRLGLVPERYDIKLVR